MWAISFSKQIPIWREKRMRERSTSFSFHTVYSVYSFSDKRNTKCSLSCPSGVVAMPWVWGGDDGDDDDGLQKQRSEMLLLANWFGSDSMQDECAGFERTIREDQEIVSCLKCDRIVFVYENKHVCAKCRNTIHMTIDGNRPKENIQIQVTYGTTYFMNLNHCFGSSKEQKQKKNEEQTRHFNLAPCLRRSGIDFIQLFTWKIAWIFNAEETNRKFIKCCRNWWARHRLANRLHNEPHFRLIYRTLLTIFVLFFFSYLFCFNFAFVELIGDPRIFH